MQTQPKYPESPRSDLTNAFAAMRRIVGDRVKTTSFLTDRARTLTAQDWIKHAIHDGASPEQAGRIIGERIQAYVLVLAPAPPKDLDRKTRVANALAAKRSQPKPQAMILGAMEHLRSGERLLATAKGVDKVSPVRDPTTGRIDVEATAKKYGLWQASQDDDEARGAKWDLQGLTARAAFGDLRGVMA